MKTLRTKHGQKYEAITVAEMVSLLSKLSGIPEAGELAARFQQYAPDMPVFATWEGLAVPLKVGSLSVGDPPTDVVPEDDCRCLWIDAER